MLTRRAIARRTLALALSTAACDSHRAEAGPQPATVPAPQPAPAGAATGEVQPPAGPGAAVADSLARAASPAVRALYVNRFAAQSARRMRELVALADSTEINALVIDLKDEFGLNYRSANPDFARNAGEMAKLRDVRALTDTLRAHGILPIARLVVFKDSVTARVHPQWTIRRPDGSAWRDHKGLAWVDPHNRALWDYLSLIHI